MCLLQLDVKISEIYAVIPSSGKREYCFGTDYLSFDTIKIVCVCVCVCVRECQGYVCTTVGDMRTLTVYFKTLGEC